MNRKKLAKLRKELANLRKNPHGHSGRDFKRIAKKFGRRKVKRGNEPNYASPVSPDLGYPLSIPNHAEIKSGTARSIIEALLSDADSWEQHLDQLEEKGLVAEGEDHDDSDDGDEDDDDDELNDGKAT